MRLLICSVAAVASLTSTVSSEEMKIALTQDGNVNDGYLWTSAFQRIDGSTCAWLKIEDNNFVEAIYEDRTGSCRSAPSSNPKARFSFISNSDAQLQFEGINFVIESNTSRLLSGSWDHVSFDPKFDVDYVVFKELK